MYDLCYCEHGKEVRNLDSQTTVRIGVIMTEDLRRKAKAAAAASGDTLNQWLVGAIEQKLESDEQVEEMKAGRLGAP
jgi:predicted HicB family RNase H-like nuclease